MQWHRSNVLFAYNITTAPGGRIDTSPVLSLDGTQIAFVESVPGSPGFAIFHVLTWHAGDGTAPDDAVAPANITSLTFSPIASDNYSSPWVDYSADIAYVATTTAWFTRLRTSLMAPLLSADLLGPLP